MGADPERAPASFTVLNSWILSEMIIFRGLVLYTRIWELEGGKVKGALLPKGMTASVIWDNHANNCNGLIAELLPLADLLTKGTKLASSPSNTFAISGGMVLFYRRNGVCISHDVETK